MTYKIFINPGHDLSCDPGAVNEAEGVTEAEIVAEIGEAVGRYLELAGYEVEVMQDNNLAGEAGPYDASVCGSANRGGYDVFVSIHCNAAESSFANGAETFYYPGSRNGVTLAEAIQLQIVNNIDVDDRGIKGANFSVLKNTNMVAVLVEMAFISNAYDVHIIKANKDEFARAIARGVTDYIQVIEGR